MGRAGAWKARGLEILPLIKLEQPSNNRLSSDGESPRANDIVTVNTIT
jgi:hypothetical protein